MKGILEFVRDTRAGATAISAVAVTVMVVGGAALIADHRWLVDQRDVLNSSSTVSTEVQKPISSKIRKL